MFAAGSKNMNKCRDSHDLIYFPCEDCPLCKALDELETLRRELQDQHDDYEALEEQLKEKP